MTNIVFEILGTVIGAFLYLLAFKLLLHFRKRFPFQSLIAGILGYAILVLIIYAFSRHPDLGHIATILGILITFIAFLFSLLAFKLKNTNFLEELSFVFLQMALGLAVLSLINSAIFNVSPYLGFDNAYNDSSAYLVIDPLQYSYIATFVFTSVLHPVLVNKKRND